MGELVNFCAGTNMHILPAKQVDAILVNVPFNGINKRAMEDTNKLFEFAGVKYSSLDSGGFQYAEAEKHGKELLFDPNAPAECSQEKVNLTPKHVIEAAANIRPTIVNALDFPIGKYTDTNDREREFMKKLGFNVRWAKECSTLRRIYCPDVKLFIPVQCFNFEQFDIFMNLIGDIEFGGFSLPTRNFDINEIALWLVKFHLMGIEEVHILGTTAYFTIALAAYMAQHYFAWVSLDATSWRESAQYSEYLNPHDLSPEYLGNVIIDERDDNNDCECPWCKDRSFTYIKNLPQTDRIAFLRCHNFWVIENACKKLYQNCHSVMELRRYLKKHTSKTDKVEELCRILSLMETLKGSDIRILEGLLT